MEKKRPKRRPTTYSILAAGERDLDLLAQHTMLLGSVEAFTPEQARRRAVEQLPAVAHLAAAQGGTVTLYAVPSGSMTPRDVKVRPTATIGADYE